MQPTAEPLPALYEVDGASPRFAHRDHESCESGALHDGGNRRTDHYHLYLDRFQTVKEQVSICDCLFRNGPGLIARTGETHLQHWLQREVLRGQSTSLPVLIDVLGKAFYTFFYGSIHGLCHVSKGENRWTINGSEWLFCLRGFFEEVHGGLEIILGALTGSVALGVVIPEPRIIFLVHVVRTSTTILHSGGEADVCRRLREDRRVQFGILDVTDDDLASRNMSILILALSGSIDCGLQMKFLCGARLDISIVKISCRFGDAIT